MPECLSAFICTDFSAKIPFLVLGTKVFTGICSTLYLFLLRGVQVS